MHFDPRDFLVLPDAAVEATLAMHESWARSWGFWNQYCKEAYWVVRPFYFFPLEMTQQYFSFIFGFPQCICEPLGKRSAEEPREAQWMRTEQEMIEEFEEAMDIATGACTELWCEVVELEKTALAA